MTAKTKTFNKFSFIRAGLRRLWLRSELRSNAIKEARYEVEGKRHKFEVECYNCGLAMRMGEVKVDHIEPCGPLTKWEHLTPFVKRLYCDTDNLQCLCNDCHKIKTKKEREDARNK